jgi:hypothetical protein
MWTLQLHFPADALPTFDTFLKQTKEARVFRRAHAVREVVTHCDAQELRPYIHPVLATFSKTRQEVVRVADRSGLHRAHQLASTLAHWHERFRLDVLPARCGHPLKPIAGFWRVMKDRIGAGRCLPDLHQLYQRTRRVLMGHHERPI